jgi:hypothetical protein
MLATLLQTTTSSDSGSGGSAAIFLLAGLVLALLTLVGYWKVFTKIGLPGWMGIVPFVNVYQIFKARGQHEPVLWLVLCLIPCISIIGAWVLASDTAEMFDKGIGWKLFLFFIPGLSHLVLGFGSYPVDPTRVAPGVGINAA